ncbi:MAG TPA: Crp/Fnr family transcriptional regulator, partial [Nitrospira sp.]
MLATPSDHSSHNLLLAALPPAEMHVFREQGQKVFLHEGKTVQAAGVDTEWVFFPTTALLSLMGVTQDGLSVETGLVGKEGMVGLQQYFGPHTQPLDCVVQQEGEVCQAPVALLRQANLPTLQRCLLGYANYRLTELAQAAVCNKFHLVRQRFTRWLLTARDRSGKDHMEFTQELLSAM